MFKKFIFKVILLFLMNFTIVHSHFHSLKEFEAQLIKCCKIGSEKAPAYQANNQASLLKIKSQEDVCQTNHTELSEVPKELKPQCLSIMQLCCTRELNKHTCRFSKSLVKRRLDHTEYSLNKQQTIKPNLIPNDSHYQQCLPNSEGLINENLQAVNSTNKLFTKIILLTGGQKIFSECCVACKLGLFSALNDYKCIIEKSIKSSKLFEESFYECCFKLKRELNLASGKSVDISSLELLVYPELRQVLPTNSLNDLFEKPQEISDLMPSRSLIGLEKNFINNKLEPSYGARTQFVVPDFYPAPKELKDIKTIPNCSIGMRLDEKKQVCIDDNCQKNLNKCKTEENCVDTKPGYRCVRKPISKPDIKKNNVKPIISNLNMPNPKSQSKVDQLNSSSKSQQTKPNVAQSLSLNHDPYHFEPHIPSSNQMMWNRQTNRPIYSNQFIPPPNMQPSMPPNSFNPPLQQFGPFNQPINYPYIPSSSNRFMSTSNLDRIRNNQLVAPKFQKRKLIDKCKIGNHNCDQNTQKCRNTENDFICVNNQDLEEFDRSNPFIDDYQVTTLLPDNRKAICQAGFQLNSDTNQCEDINECETELHNCTANYRCDNKIGSFICIREMSCGTGYTFNQDSDLCEDINECQLNLHHCKGQYKCVNYEGTFRCELTKCEEGYRLLDNKCIEVFCSPGFKFSQLSEKCVDQNECLTGVDPKDVDFAILNKSEINEKLDSNKYELLSNGRFRACGKNEKCINLPGGYFCQNSFSKQSTGLMNEQLTDDYLKKRYLNERVQIITNNYTDCQEVSNTKYTDSKEIDRSKTKICNYRCAKIDNEWTCVCPEGFNLKHDGSKCAMFDQCKQVGTCKSNEFCFNKRDSFSCIDIKCPIGYLKNSRNPLQCVILDKSNVINMNKPKYISNSYLSLKSKMDLKNQDSVLIASIRGTATLEVDFRLLFANSSANFDQTNLAKIDDFQLKRTENDHIYMKRSLIGPQEIQLEFIYTTNQDNKKIIMNQLFLTIYVSKYSF